MQKNPGLTCASGIELFFMNKAKQGRTLAYIRQGLYIFHRI
jgi:hypothetical protein